MVVNEYTYGVLTSVNFVMDPPTTMVKCRVLFFDPQPYDFVQKMRNSSTLNLCESIHLGYDT